MSIVLDLPLKYVPYGIETLTFMGTKICALVPNDFRKVKSISELKRKIKLWKPEKCPCRVCKIYIAGVGFVDVKKEY